MHFQQWYKKQNVSRKKLFKKGYFSHISKPIFPKNYYSSEINLNVDLNSDLELINILVGVLFLSFYNIGTTGCVAISLTLGDVRVNNKKVWEKHLKADISIPLILFYRASVDQNKLITCTEFVNMCCVSLSI